jgi:predicted Zn-dependent protease
VALELTWIAHPQLTLRLTAMASEPRFRVYSESFRAAARSLHPLTRAERARIQERRLRVVRAREGEGLAGLSRRSGNAWSVAETAVANGLPQEVSLGAGERVKIAVEAPYAR